MKTEAKLQAPGLVKVKSAADIGGWVRAQRKARGIKQQELASYCGCSAKFLTDLENGKPTVRLDKVLPVVMMLGSDLCINSRKAGL